MTIASKSVVYNKDKRGHRTDLRDTPYCINSAWDDAPSTRTDWVLPDRYDKNQLWTVFPMPYVMLSRLSMSRWTQSNAADNSSSAIRARWPSFSALITSEKTIDDMPIDDEAWHYWRWGSWQAECRLFALDAWTTPTDSTLNYTCLCRFCQVLTEQTCWIVAAELWPSTTMWAWIERTYDCNENRSYVYKTGVCC